MVAVTFSWIPPLVLPPPAAMLSGDPASRSSREGPPCDMRHVAPEGGWHPCQRFGETFKVGYFNVTAFGSFTFRNTTSISQTSWVTPLHAAAEDGHTTVCELLIRSGADVNAKYKVGRRAESAEYDPPPHRLDTTDVLLLHLRTAAHRCTL